MSAQNPSDNHPQSWEGSRLQPANDVELQDALGRAVDYRGDVTIHLKTGEQVVGYVFDRQEVTPHPFVKVFLANQSEPCTVNCHDIAEVEFGEDTAFGRSWEDWAKKWQKPPMS
jgi:hypothetical protein